MSGKRRRHTDEFKAKVALEAIKGVWTVGQLGAAYGVHPTVIAHWKRQLMERAGQVFSHNGGGSGRSEEDLTKPLYEEIGRLKVEVDWLKKKL